MKRRSLTGLATLAALLIVCCQASAQEAVGLTVDLVDQRIATLNAGSGNEELLEIYEQTKTLLNRAQSQEREVTTYVESLASAAARELEIQERLDELDDAYDPEQDISGFTAEELITRLSLARAEGRDLTTRLEALDRRLAAREVNATAIRTRVAEIDLLADALPDEPLTVNAADPPSRAEANRWRDAAQLLALVAERRAIEAQLASQPARYSVMAAERAELVLTLERRSTLIRTLESKSTDTLLAAVEPADLNIAESDPGYALAAALAKSDADLRVEQVDIRDRLAEIRRQNDEIVRASRALDERYATTQRIVDFAGDSDVLGRVLLTSWDELGTYKVDDPTFQLSREAGGAVISRIDHEEALNSIVSTSVFVNRQMLEASIDPESVPAATRSRLLELARGYRERLRSTIAAESEYIETLGALETSYSALTTKNAQYRDYLESLVLWIPNHPPLWKLTMASINADVVYIEESLSALEYSVNPLLGLAALVAVALFFARGRLLSLQSAMNSRILKPREDSIRFTLIASLAAILRALPVPIVLLATASGFDDPALPGSQSLAGLIAATALLLFSFSLVRILSEPHGIARSHFGWRAATMDRIHEELVFMLRWGLPAAVFAAFINRLTPPSSDEAIGRLLSLVALLLISYHFSAHQLRELRVIGRSWFNNTLNRLRLLLNLVFLLAITAVVYGQVFTVSVIIVSVIDTVWIGVALLLLHAVLLRWLRVARRHLRLTELMAQRNLRSGEEGAAIEEKLPELGDISAETQQLITTATIVTAAAAILYIWSPLLPAFDAFGRVALWTSTSELDGETIVNQITLATLITVAILTGLTLFAAQRLPAVVEIILRSRTGVSPGARYAVSTLMNYIIIGFGIVAALTALGLKWGQLQWLVAALGVGIGFGLQEIVANFISGLIILFERPIRVGDVITIGDKDGTVLRIRIRATTIRDWDGKELLVPNKEFITGRLLNWTLSNAETRLVLDVGIAYGSDVEAALRILMEVLTSHPKVLAEPPPSVLFLGFGDNSLNLQARCFLAKVDDRMPTTSALNTRINLAFEAAGIVVAFPQRDVHFDAAAPIRIAIDPPPTTSS